MIPQRAGGPSDHGKPGLRLAAIDIDDTLLGPDGQVSAANARAVGRLRDAGVEVVLASGRAFGNVLPFYRQLGLGGYVVSDGGAMVRHPGSNRVPGHVLYHHPLAEPDAKAAIAGGRARGLTVLLFRPDGAYADRRDAYTAMYEADAGTTPVTRVAPADLPTTDVLKVMWAGPTDAVAAAAAAAGPGFAGRFATVVSNPWLFELTAAGVNKATALDRVAGHLGVRPAEAAAFGDGNNDAEMLAWAGAGVAMAYGRDAAKRAARFVSPPGDPETALARAVDLVLAAA